MRRCSIARMTRRRVEKLDDLGEFLATHRRQVRQGRARARRPFQQHAGARARRRRPRPLVNEVVLRAQAQAEYTHENYGHFGLNLRRYAHFTSPIRRYADLIVHRALIRALNLGDGRPHGHARRRTGAKSPQHISGRRAARHGGRARNRRPPDRRASGRQHRRDLRGPHRRRHPRRPVRQARRDRRRRLHSRRDARRRLFPLRGRQRARSSARARGETFRLGDSVEVRLVEAAPFAGALRFEMSRRAASRRSARQTAGRSAGGAGREARYGTGPKEGNDDHDADVHSAACAQRRARPRALGLAMRRGFEDAVPIAARAACFAPI